MQFDVYNIRQQSTQCFHYCFIWDTQMQFRLDHLCTLIRALQQSCLKSHDTSQELQIYFSYLSDQHSASVAPQSLCTTLSTHDSVKIEHLMGLQGASVSGPWYRTTCPHSEQYVKWNRQDKLLKPSAGRSENSPLFNLFHLKKSNGWEPVLHGRI